LNFKPQTPNFKLDESNMKTSDILLLILAIALIAGMLLTAIFGRGSRHGYGKALFPSNTILTVGK
jgi:hypothetical protein